MFINKSAQNAGLDKAIDSALNELASLEITNEDYSTAVDQLTKLYAIKDAQSSNRLSKDTLAIVVGNLVGILVIVGHEQAHVVTSKALGFVMKAR